GLHRLGLAELPPHVALEPELLLPAVAQGILAIECREEATETRRILAALEHAPSRRRAEAERGVLGALSADCTVPLAAFAEGNRLRACLWEGGQPWEAEAELGEEAEAVGHALGLRLLAAAGRLHR
ncbi:MAG TPA: hydroxymethylbilane synthase, partial [Myxococcota bacterium]|nr:hydroxymethylbilane synthase [Myxococcota bacterium]